MCYSHFGNEVCNGAISITLRGFNSDSYKVKSIGQWGKILVMAMGFVDHLGLGLLVASAPVFYGCSLIMYIVSKFKLRSKLYASFII